MRPGTTNRWIGGGSELISLSCGLPQPVPSASDEFVLILSEGREPGLVPFYLSAEIIPLTSPCIVVCVGSQVP
jgi:hypothetical protein